MFYGRRKKVDIKKKWKIEDRRIEAKNSHHAQAMALEEFTGYIVIVPWSLSGITGAGRYYRINTHSKKKEAIQKLEGHEEEKENWTDFIDIRFHFSIFLNSTWIWMLSCLQFCYD